MHNIYTYVERPIEFIEQVSSSGWQIKVYAISATSLPLPRETVSQAIKHALPQLPQPAVTEQRYGVGFLIIHQGMQRNWILLDWWEGEDIMHHKLFSSPLDDPGNITPEPDKSLIACVHELRIVTFESEAWIKTALCGDDKPGFEDYLGLRLNPSD